mgnify:CR=1 FL=1
MRVVTWNCNGKFREKYRAIKKLDADIYVIQECENPEITGVVDYQKFAQNHIWEGHNNKGLGIFAKKEVSLKNNFWKPFGLEWFISCTINNEITLVGIWACGNYIADIYVYLQIYNKRLSISPNKLICGDFNSNTRWDNKRKIRTHTAVANKLAEQDLFSAYHMFFQESQGKESKPTFFMHRHKDKPYHIDYMFYNPLKISNFSVGSFEDWIALSDHVPLILDISLKKVSRG